MNELKMHISEHGQAVAAKTATIISGGGFVTSMASANEAIQLVAGIVAIVAGVAAAWWHFERIHDARQRRKERRDNNSGGS
jgi:hypothetical protein